MLALFLLRRGVRHAGHRRSPGRSSQRLQRRRQRRADQRHRPATSGAATSDPVSSTPVVDRAYYILPPGNTAASRPTTTRSTSWPSTTASLRCGAT
ncbi:MAG: hypothetical protein R2695_02850 [Acidimicrobiales bacterium]